MSSYLPTTVATVTCVSLMSIQDFASDELRYMVLKNHWAGTDKLITYEADSEDEKS